MKRPQLRSRAQRRFAPRLEALESRYAPTCSWNSATNVLTGTGPDDVVEVRPKLTNKHVYCNGSLIAFAEGSSMTFNAAAWGDHNTLKLNNVDSYIGSYTVTNTSLTSHGFTTNFNANVEHVELHTGLGDDAVTVKTGHSFNAPSVFVYGGAGNDTLVPDDSGFSGNSTWVLDEDRVYDFDGHASYFFDVENVALTAGPGNDYVVIGSTTTGTLENLPVITIYGQVGVDKITFNDSGYSGGDTYTIGEAQVSLPNSLGVIATYFGVEDLNLKTGAGADSIAVSQNESQNFMFAAGVTVNAGGGIDTLTANDSGDAGGKTYHVTDVDVCKETTFTTCVGYDNNLENLTLKTGAGSDTIEVSGSGNMLFDKPLVYVDPGAGGNTLIVDDSGRATDEVYRITESDVILPNTFGQTVIYPNGKIQTLTLKTGAGVDDITVSNSVGTLAQLPDINVDGGGGVGGTGVNTLTVSDAAYVGGDTYSITNNQVSLPNTLGLIVTYSNIYILELWTGTGDATVNVGNSDGTVVGMPYCHINTNGGNDTLNVDDHNNPNGATYNYDTYGTDSLVDLPNAGYVLSGGFEKVNLSTGAADDVANVGGLDGNLEGLPDFSLNAGGGTDTLNVYDQKNPAAATYVATSAGTGVGALAVPSLGFDASFQSINVVNLHRSLKPGTVVDKSGYSPADYVLNVIPNKPVGNAPPQEQPQNPMIVNPSPIPAPPIRDPEAATPAADAPWLKPASGRRAAWPIGADPVFADPLGEPVSAFDATR